MSRFFKILWSVIFTPLSAFAIIIIMGYVNAEEFYEELFEKDKK